MRFMTRSLLGVMIFALTLSLLGFAGWRVASTMAEREAREDRRRPPQERVFSVNVDTLRLGEAIPEIIAFGEVASWRELEMRAAASGRIVELAEAFRDGGQVAAGEVLYRIDPATAQSDLSLVATEVKEAEAELIEARAALELSQVELKAAEEQRALREAALARQTSLKERGVGSDAAVEAASISLSSAVQTELTRKQALAQAQARILRAEIGVERRRIDLADAERRLADTVATAPFDGLVSAVEAVEGGLVAVNERIGALIDPGALEVAFRVSNAQFARIVDANGLVRPVEVTATLDLAGTPVTVPARIDRAGAEVGDGQTGRLIYARIAKEDGVALRPGDFMEVRITETPLSDVAVLPATAINARSEILIVGEGERLEAVPVTLLRRQGDTVIVADVPQAREYVTRLQPQLGPGVQIKPIRPDAGMEEKQFVELDPARRAELIAAVEANTFMPGEAKARVIANLRKDRVPAETVARLERRLGLGGGHGGAEGGGSDAETVELDADRQAALIAYVEANERMPEAAKTRILGMLETGKIAADTLERLESRIGGGAAPPRAAGGDEDMIELDADRRERLVAFVEGNARMPDDVKTRILEQLREKLVPSAVVARIEARMGG